VVIVPDLAQGSGSQSLDRLAARAALLQNQRIVVLARENQKIIEKRTMQKHTGLQ
jgi:hypothetical protein